MSNRKKSSRLKKYKPKTNKSAKKRFKVTATGKVLFHPAGHRHLMSSKNAKKRRQGRKLRRMYGSDRADVHKMLHGQPGI